MSKRSSSSIKSPFPNPFAFKSNYWTTETQVDDQVSKIALTETDRAKLLTRGYEIGTLLGKGDFGQVYRSTYYKMPCVVKSTSHKYATEVNMLKRMSRHAHVVQMFDLYLTGKRRLLIFMELMEGGDMEQLLKERKSWLSEREARHYYLQFGDAFRYMHSLGIGHGDIHTGNILLDHTKQVCKVADFGQSRRFYDSATGELAFDPFCFEGDIFKGDLRRTGLLLHTMLNATYDEDDDENDDDELKLPTRVNYFIYFNSSGQRHFENKTLSWQARQAIVVHDVRPSFEEILSDEPWFRMKG